MAERPSVNDLGWKLGMPWLYYQKETATNIIQSSGKIDLTVSFVKDDKLPERKTQLNFTLARYSINGTFNGFNKLNTELSLCPMTYQDVINTQKFGTVTRSVCEFQLSQLKT